MASLDELTSAIPIDQLAARLGVDVETAQGAVSTALPALLGGLTANAQDPAGAASLAAALSTKSSSLVDGGVNLDDVDVDDGDKIVGNVFGSQKDQVVAALASDSRTPDAGIISKVLPLLAPIVLSFLAKKGGGGATSSAAAPAGGGIGDLLGGLLGGGGGGGGGGLGGLLGGLFGGGSAAAAGPGGIDVGGLLGGLLGGGKR